MNSKLAWWVLIALTAANCAVEIAYIVARAAPSPMLVLLPGIAVSTSVIMWIEADARQRRLVPCFDFPLLLMATYPLSILWYAFWSRGVRGVLLLAGLLGLIVVLPILVQLAAYSYVANSP